MKATSRHFAVSLRLWCRGGDIVDLRDCDRQTSKCYSAQIPDLARAAARSEVSDDGSVAVGGLILGQYVKDNPEDVTLAEFRDLVNKLWALFGQEVRDAISPA